MLKRTPTQGVNPESVARRFEEWYSTEFRPGYEATVRSIQAPEGSGSGDMIWLIEIAMDSQSIEQLILRIEAVRRRPYGLSFDVPFDVQRQLHLRGAVKVARVEHVEVSDEWFGRPFAVTEKLPGRVVPDRPPFTFESWLRDVSPETQEACWWNAIEAMAGLHTLDVDGSGLGFMATEGMVVGVESALLWFRELMDATEGNRFRPKAEALWEKLNEELPNRLGDDVLSWGDARIGNVIFDERNQAALIDFEEVTLTQPEADLAKWLLFDQTSSAGFGLPRLPGFPSHAATIDRYAELLGRPIGDLEWWKTFARFRNEAMRSSLSLRV
jgi:aminoglycoside phosphotransferase (APT) family kinase protein